jgi:hypothetical protein
MKLTIWLLMTMFLVSSSLSLAAKTAKAKYPDTTGLCEIKLDDRFTQVVKKYGNNFVQTKYGKYEPIESIIYNDPKLPAHLAIGCGNFPFPGINQAKVSSITLKKGYYGKKGHFASKSFAGLGTISGANLGDSKQDLKKRYAKINFWKEEGLEIGNVVVDSTPNWSCDLTFTLEKGKVIEVVSQFSQ